MVLDDSLTQCPKVRSMWLRPWVLIILICSGCLYVTRKVVGACRVELVGWNLSPHIGHCCLPLQWGCSANSEGIIVFIFALLSFALMKWLQLQPNIAKALSLAMVLGFRLICWCNPLLLCFDFRAQHHGQGLWWLFCIFFWLSWPRENLLGYRSWFFSDLSSSFLQDLAPCLHLLIPGSTIWALCNSVTAAVGDLCKIIAQSHMRRIALIMTTLM